MTLDGNVEFGSWFNHTREWWDAIHGKQRQQHSQALWLHYEDILNDMPTAVRMIADFLGITTGISLDKKDATMNLSLDELVDRVVGESSFERMKGRAVDSYNRLVRMHGRSKVPGSPAHFRRGTIGDWKHELSADEIALLDGAFEEHVNKPLAGHLRYTWG